MARAILEYDPNIPSRLSAPHWDLVRSIHDPAAPEGPQDLIDLLATLARGYANGPWNGFTSAAGIQAALSAFGLPWEVVYTTDAGSVVVTARARTTSLALLWVDGSILWPSSYAGSYFGGDWGWDHIIVSLPDDNLFNDPLTDVPDKKTDVRYSWDAISTAVGGIWLLPPPEGVSSFAVVVATASLKRFPNHLGPPANSVIAPVSAGTKVTLLPTRTPHWQRVSVVDGLHTGWLLISNLKAV